MYESQQINKNVIFIYFFCSHLKRWYHVWRHKER